MDARWRELGLEDNDEYLVWRLHPNRVISNEYPECSNPNSPRCPTTRGRNLYIFLYVDHILLILTGSVFLVFVEMSMNIAQRHEAASLARETAIKNSELNLAQAVERSSLVAVRASSKDTTTVPSPSVPTRSPSTSKSSDKSKGKEPAPPSTTTKRARKGSKVEPPRKKTSQSSCPLSSSESDET